MTQSSLVYMLLIIRSFKKVKKRGKNWKSRRWVHETLIVEIIFVTFTEDSSAITNDMQKKETLWVLFMDGVQLPQG